MRKPSGRPFFDQPDIPRCMWRGCPKQTLLSKDIPMCTAHSIIISDALALKDGKEIRRETIQKEQLAGLRPYTAWQLQEMEAFQRNIAKQEQLNTERFNNGQPPKPGTLGVPSVDRVYYIRVGEHIKIGYSRNISVRLNGYPPNSELLAVELGSKELEKQRHQQFHAYLAWGREWFSDCDELRNHIATLPPLSDTGRKRMRRGPANQIPTIKPRYWR